MVFSVLGLRFADQSSIRVWIVQMSKGGASDALA
jgi:hypothetical protein